MRELAELRTNPPEGIRVVTNEDNMLDVTGIIEGPGAHPQSSIPSYLGLQRVLMQRARRMREDTLGLGSSSRRSSPPRHRNVRMSTDRSRPVYS